MTKAPVNIFIFFSDQTQDPISYQENQAFSARKYSIHNLQTINEDIERLENNIIEQASVTSEVESMASKMDSSREGDKNKSNVCAQSNRENNNEPKSTEELAAYVSIPVLDDV